MFYYCFSQPDVPYALGGCIVEDTLSDDKDMELILEGLNEGVEFISESLVSVGMFTIPKDLHNTQQDHGCNFDVFSLILESSDWSKANVQNAINEVILFIFGDCYVNAY